mgnify:FL=1
MPAELDKKVKEIGKTDYDAANSSNHTSGGGTEIVLYSGGVEGVGEVPDINRYADACLSCDGCVYYSDGLVFDARHDGSYYSADEEREGGKGADSEHDGDVFDGGVHVCCVAVVSCTEGNRGQ